MSLGTSPLTVRGFYNFPATRTQFFEQTKRSPLLASLWANIDGSAINANSTLPMTMKTKDQIYADIKESNPQASLMSLKVKQAMGYGKILMSFYKSGIKNVWNNHKLVSKLSKHYKITNQINNQGKDVDIRIPNFGKLTQEMALSLSMNTTEHKAVNNRNHGNVIKGEVVTVDRDLFSLTRAEFQLINRTNKDFYKLPLFVLVCLVFAETTPLLCYAVPEVTPSTCVLPSIVPRMWKSKTKQELAKLSQNLDEEGLENLALKTSYNLPLHQARLLCQSLRLVSKYVPVQLYPESVLRSRLNHYYNYLKVDNYYLSGFTKGNVWNLTDEELVVASLERGIIDDIKKEMEFESEEQKHEYMNQLRLRLVKFIVDFDNYNIGYLAINHAKLDTAPVAWR